MSDEGRQIIFSMTHVSKVTPTGKQIIKDIIESEDKKKPFSDDKLETILNDKGYNIARRTVAKYREQLNLPVARLRKEMK